MMKKFITLALSAMMAVSACAGLASCGEKKRGENEILIWAGGQWQGDDAKNLQKYVDWYNDNNDLGVTVDLQPVTNFEQTFTAEVNAGRGPDLMIWDRFNTPSYAISEVLEPLDDLIERDSINADDFNATAYNEMSYAGVQYGLPLDLDMWGIYVNMDIVQTYNTQNPNSKITCFWNEDGSDRSDWTWSEMLDVATKLKGITHNNKVVKSGYDGNDINEFFFHYYASTNQPFFDEDGRTSVNTEYGNELLTLFHSLYASTWEEGYVDQRAFVQGTLAMYMRPTYFISYLNKNASHLNVRFMPQPKYDGENGGGANRGVLGGYGFVIPRPINEKNRTEAWETKKEKCWELMKDWLCSEENMTKWAEIIQTTPALKAVHDNDVITNNKILSSAVPYADSYTIRPALPGWKDVQTNVFNVSITDFCQGQNTESNRDKTLRAIETNADRLFDQYSQLS